MVVAACQQYNFDDIQTDNTTASAVTPTGLGLGTQLCPLTTDQVIAESLTGEQWVAGYVVGSAYKTMNNCTFSATTPNTSNVLIASDSLCTDAEKCVPVELNTTTLQQFSLAHHPQGFRQCLVVKGSLARYFSHPGIRQVTQAYLLPDLDLSTLHNMKQDWSEWDGEY
ncbi:MAG: hypothetical protein HUK02_02665 [Bacteroidaceae bacterium]|nr:hypothetical protein [Bacteroidaceae bacterium]